LIESDPPLKLLIEIGCSDLCWVVWVEYMCIWYVWCDCKENEE